MKLLKKSKKKYLNYGEQIGISMCMGLLFLGKLNIKKGCGKYSLSTNKLSIAFLLCSIYPNFQMNSFDNKYHLQLLRNFYVLSTEKRLLELIDIDKKTQCKINIEVKLRIGKTIKLMTPCLLPELNLIEMIIVNSNEYWNYELKDMELLKKNKLYLYVKKKFSFYLDKYNPNLFEDEFYFKNIFFKNFINNIYTENIHLISYFENFLFNNFENNKNEMNDKTLLKNYFLSSLNSFNSLIIYFYQIILLNFKNLIKEDDKMYNILIWNFKILFSYHKMHKIELFDNLFIEYLKLNLKKKLIMDQKKLDLYFKNGTIIDEHFSNSLIFWDIPSRNKFLEFKKYLEFNNLNHNLVSLYLLSFFDNINNDVLDNLINLF
jgi:hypothetical protein